MRKSYSFYSLIGLSSVFLFGNCSIIAEVDRTKIPQGGTNATAGEGGDDQGGTGGSRGGSAGNGTGGNAGAGEGGMGGDAGGDTGGTGGDAGAGMGGTDMGGAGMGGDAGGGSGGAPGAECGNGDVEDGEECDDGDMPPDGDDGCSATCTVEDGWECVNEPSDCSTECGDGIEAGAEACDDGNSLACGTCNAACSMDIASAAATGSITPSAPGDILETEFFTLNDGSGPTEFEFDATPGDGVGSNRVAIVFDPAGDAAALQTAIVGAINGATGFGITAAASGATNIALTNEAPGTAGNQTTGESVSGSFAITPMTGGSAHDCGTGTGCRVPADCTSGACTNGTCG